MGEDDQSSSRSEASVKEKSKSKSPEAEELVGGGGGGGGGAPASSASKLEKIALYIAIVALVLCLIALALSCYLAMLWWYWNLVLTVPALAIALVALFFAPLCPKKKMPLFQPGHHEISLGFGALGILLGLSGLIWCCVEIGWAHTYQGSMSPFSSGDPAPLRHRRSRSVNSNGYQCYGRAYDWGYRSQGIVMEKNCERKKAKLQKKNQGKVGDLAKEIIPHQSGHSAGWPKYEGVDSYKDSPVYQTHKDIVGKNSADYMLTSLAKTAATEKLAKTCKDFDELMKTSKFYENREKCDKALKKLKPKCEKDKEGKSYEYKYTVEDPAKHKEAADACKANKEGEEESKYYRAGARLNPNGGSEDGGGGSGGGGVECPPGVHGRKCDAFKTCMNAGRNAGKCLAAAMAGR